MREINRRAYRGQAKGGRVKGANRNRENETAARFRCSNYFCSRSRPPDDKIGPCAKLTYFTRGKGWTKERMKRERAMEIHFSVRSPSRLSNRYTQRGICTFSPRNNGRNRKERERKAERERERDACKQVTRGDGASHNYYRSRITRCLWELGGLFSLAVPICRNIHYRES